MCMVITARPPCLVLRILIFEGNDVIGGVLGLAATTAYQPSSSQFSSDTWGSFGVIFQSTPVATAPTVTTESAETITPTSATLQATVNPGNLATTYAFDWGTTSGYGNVSTVQSAGSGSSTVPADLLQLNGLSPSTTYHFRVTATNSLGTTNGSDANFTTSAQGADWTAYLGDPSYLDGDPHVFDFFSPKTFEPYISTGPTAIASAITASASVTAGNSEAVALAAAITASASVTAGNAETVQLACAISASASVTAGNHEAAVLASAITASTTLTATNSEAAALASAIAPSLAVTASSTESATLASAITASLTVTPNLTIILPLAAAITASATVTAGNSESAALASAISASATVTPTNSALLPLAASLTASATVTAQSTEAAALASSITPSLTVTANSDRDGPARLRHLRYELANCCQRWIGHPRLRDRS